MPKKQFYDLSGLTVTVKHNGKKFHSETAKQLDSRHRTWFQVKFKLNTADANGFTVAVGGTEYPLYRKDSRQWYGESSFVTDSGIVSNTWCNLTRFGGHAYGITVSCEGQCMEGVQ